jgi:excisionase family DNA binding protein
VRRRIEMKKRWIGAIETARILGVSRQTVWRLVRDGKLDAIEHRRISKQTRFSEKDVYAFAKARTRKR